MSEVQLQVVPQVLLKHLNNHKLYFKVVIIVFIFLCFVQFLVFLCHKINCRLNFSGCGHARLYIYIFAPVRDVSAQSKRS